MQDGILDEAAEEEQELTEELTEEAEYMAFIERFY
jgi:hypothetical protein